MRVRFALVATFSLATSLVLSGCTPDTQRAESTIVVSYGNLVEELDVARELRVAEGSTFDVLLFANPESGFEWQEATISDNSVVELLERTHRSQDGTPPTPPLTPRQDVWTFQASGTGSSTTTMRYSQPWDGGRKSVWTFTLTVAVG